MDVANQAITERVVRHTFTFEQYQKKDEVGLFGPDDRVERHTDPAPDGYRSITIAGSGETLESRAAPGLSIPVDAVLGTPRKSDE